MAKFNSELFEYYKSNANHFNEFEEKAQQQQQAISELKDRLDSQNRDDFARKSALMETRIA